jgi:anti-anti-sigma factor
VTDQPYTRITEQETGGALVLTIVDDKLREYDMCEKLGQELEHAYNKSQCVNVAVDLQQVEFIASVGYMPLLGLSGDVRRCGGQMAVFNMSDFVAKVFETTRSLINPNQHEAPFLAADDLDSAVAALCELN